MNLIQLTALFKARGIPETEDIYIVDQPTTNIVLLHGEDIYYGPIIQEEASVGIDTLVIARKI